MRVMNGWLAAALVTGTILCTGDGAAHAQATAEAPHVVFVTGDDEYRSEITMPMIAGILEKTHEFRTSVAYARPRPQTKDNIEGLEALESADLMVLFVRFRQLPEDQLERVLRFVDSGKPLIGLRTTTHAFQYPDGHPRAALNDGFGRDVFGQKWIVHHGHRSTTEVAVRQAQADHPILRGVGPFAASSWLYHVTPLHGENRVLLEGTSVGSDRADRAGQFPLTQPVAWTRHYNGARVFFTTLGHPGDFAHQSMRKLLINAIYWGLGRDVPEGGAAADVVGIYEPPEPFDLSKVQ